MWLALKWERENTSSPFCLFGVIFLGTLCFRCLIVSVIHSFFAEIERIAREDYIPESKDILRVRNRTQGVVEKNIKVNEYCYR